MHAMRAFEYYKSKSLTKTLCGYIYKFLLSLTKNALMVYVICEKDISQIFCESFWLGFYYHAKFMNTFFCI